MTPAVVTPLLLAFMAFMMVRRIRLQLTSQAVRPVMMALRMLMLTAVAVLLVAMTGGAPAGVAACALGLAGGLGLAFYAFKHTRMELTPKGLFFTPNRWIGMGVSALILIRLGTRVASAYAAGDASPVSSAPPTPLDALAMLQKSPLTLAMFMLLAGYYVAYYAAILWRSRREGRPAA